MDEKDEPSRGIHRPAASDLGMTEQPTLRCSGQGNRHQREEKSAKDPHHRMLLEAECDSHAAIHTVLAHFHLHTAQHPTDNATGKGASIDDLKG